MIDKRMGDFKCVSCNSDTPVEFLVKNSTGSTLFELPLCRECSNMFAADMIDSLRRKVEKKREINSSLLTQLKSAKMKIKQMNTISHKHKENITSLINQGKEEVFEDE